MATKWRKDLLQRHVSLRSYPSSYGHYLSSYRFHPIIRLLFDT